MTVLVFRHAHHKVSQENKSNATITLNQNVFLLLTCLLMNMMLIAALENAVVQPLQSTCLTADVCEDNCTSFFYTLIRLFSVYVLVIYLDLPSSWPPLCTPLMSYVTHFFHSHQTDSKIQN